MPNTRKFSLPLYEEIELFKNSFCNDSTLKSIGCKPVLIINVQGASNWADVMAEFNNQNFVYILNNIWMKVPVAIINHNLFKSGNSFLDDVENISNSNQFNPYYTDGHVETGGKDSISYTPVIHNL